MNYEVIFNEKSSTQCTKNPTYNKTFIDSTLKYYQYLVACKGYVFLNDVLFGLGLERVRRGQTEGWKTEINTLIIVKENNEFELIFNTVLTKKATYMHMADMRVDMGYDQSSAIEKGLIDNIVLCWLRLHICEFHYEKYTVNASIARALFWEKVLSATQKRYLRSVEALARIRKLQQPAPNPLTLALVKAQVNAGGEAPPKKLPKWVNPMEK